MDLSSILNPTSWGSSDTQQPSHTEQPSTAEAIIGAEHSHLNNNTNPSPPSLTSLIPPPDSVYPYSSAGHYSDVVQRTERYWRENEVTLPFPAPIPTTASLVYHIHQPRHLLSTTSLHTSNGFASTMAASRPETQSLVRPPVYPPRPHQGETRNGKIFRFVPFESDSVAISEQHRIFRLNPPGSFHLKVESIPHRSDISTFNRKTGRYTFESRFIIVAISQKTTFEI
jgi:hypothetical protein